MLTNRYLVYKQLFTFKNKKEVICTIFKNRCTVGSYPNSPEKS